MAAEKIVQTAGWKIPGNSSTEVARFNGGVPFGANRNNGGLDPKTWGPVTRVRARGVRDHRPFPEFS
jgi:hypothetical protein